MTQLHDKSVNNLNKPSGTEDNPDNTHFNKHPTEQLNIQTIKETFKQPHIETTQTNNVQQSIKNQTHNQT